MYGSVSAAISSRSWMCYPSLCAFMLTERRAHFPPRQVFKRLVFVCAYPQGAKGYPANTFIAVRLRLAALLLAFLTNWCNLQGGGDSVARPFTAEGASSRARFL